VEELESKHFPTTCEDAIEFCYRKGWSDGLPVVPPTAGRIKAMLDAASLAPGAELARIDERQAVITAEKAAINAVMAGCLPEYMPVVCAALRAMGDPAWGFHGPATSTTGTAVLLIVNGPAAQRLNINSGENLFGPGWRANATIGRAVRLVMRNVAGTLPGELDRGTFGHPGKYTFCIAENERVSPWPPLHVERGFKPGQSTVTVAAAVSPQQVYNEFTSNAEAVLQTLCEHMRISAATGFNTQYVLIFGQEHMQLLARENWKKDDIRNYCHRNSRSSLARLKTLHIVPGGVLLGDDARMVPLVPEPDDFIVLAAGGANAGFSVFVPGWADVGWSRSVTCEIT